MKKIFLALMAVAAIAIVGCNGHHVNEPEDQGEPNPEENIKLLQDTDPANQNKWGLAPERIPLPVTYTENDEE
ncbi:MAG: hypothetical protein MJZ64_01955 [Paludibacteraceae bacterium]|nr:hypothetical protein [Paludibacteraceae bacterium]